MQAPGDEKRWTLRPGDVHLHYAHPESLTDPALAASMEALLSDDERDRRQRFAFERDRHRFLVTRALVRTILSHYADVAPEAWTFELNAWGKPEVRGTAVPLRFNVSHTAGLAACAVTLQRDVGVDVESLDRRSPGLPLAERFFAPAEVQALRRVPADRFLAAFLDYWTLKESYIKARGMGLSLPLADFAFHLDPAGPVRIAFAPAMNDRPERWQFIRLTLKERHKVAVALQREAADDLRLTLHEWPETASVEP